jgi:histidine triad (HIT) family protein
MAENEFEEDTENLTPEQAAKLQRENCIFCKLISGDIPSKKVYEDPDFVGILDINPASEGHVLLLPRQHFQILPQMPQELVGNLGVACSNVSAKIIKSFKCEGTSIFMANGAVAGQRAPHFMVHVIPRKEGDNIDLNPKLKVIEDDAFEAVKENLFSSMKRHPAQQPTEQSSSEKETEEENMVNEEELAEEKEERSLALPDEDTYTDDDTDSQITVSDDEEEQKEKKEKKKSKKKKEASPKSAPSKKGASKSEPQSNKIDYDKLSRMLG